VETALLIGGRAHGHTLQMPQQPLLWVSMHSGEPELLPFLDTETPAIMRARAAARGRDDLSI